MTPKLIAVPEQVLAPPGPDAFEKVRCYVCGSLEADPFISAQDDLTGKPGTFTFVRCRHCDLVYQQPRLILKRIYDYYDDNYIAHRKQTSWGVLTPLYRWAMDKLDRDKQRLIVPYVTLDATSRVLDVGCGAGTFLASLSAQYGCRAEGVDFKDLSHLPAFQHIPLHCGLLYELPLPEAAYDLITMWHFLEHDYDPMLSLRTARQLINPDGRLVVEVPRLDCVTFRMFGRRWPGLQAPQHTVLLTKALLHDMLKQSGWQVEAYLPFGAFPAYFYLFAGAAFTIRRGRGINLARAMYPYFFGQLLLSPILLAERRLNLAMQTVICRPAAAA